MAIGYLALTGILYFWLGAACSSSNPSTSFIPDGILDDSVALPAAVFVHAAKNHVTTYPIELDQLFPAYRLSEDLRSLATIVASCGLVAVAAAVIMFSELRIGYVVWLGFAALSALVGLWYLIGSVSSRGFLAENQIWLALWTSSYVGTYWFTRPIKTSKLF